MNYVDNAIRTESNDFPKIMKRLSSTTDLRLLHAGMGLATEAAKFVDALKKYVFYGTEPDTTNLIEEMGDLFWYLAIAADALGVSFETIQQRNIAKFAKRYPDKFTEADAVHRDLPSEREMLEGGKNQDDTEINNERTKQR